MSASSDTQVANLSSLNKEQLFTANQRRDELGSKIRCLIENVEDELERMRQVDTDQARITLVIEDEDQLAGVIERHARELKPFFEAYIMMAKFNDQVSPMSLDQAIRCVDLVYRLLTYRLVEEPDVIETIYLAWRGILELS